MKSSLYSAILTIILLISVSVNKAVAQPLDETWILSVGAESIQVNPDGSFLIPNISAPDDFGPGGPGSSPDFLSDDWVRLTGYSTAGDVTMYVWTNPFRVVQGEPIYITDSDLTFSTSPPPVPKSLRAIPGKITLTLLGETTQMAVTAFLADDTQKDASLASQYTTYRTSNIRIARVSPDGLVTGASEGKVFITAINEGVTAVAQINVAPGADITSVSGVVTDQNGEPVEGAEVVLAGLAITGTTNSDGVFFIQEVPISDQLTIDAITVQFTSDSGSFFGSTTTPDLAAGAITDAGLITLTNLCDQLGDEFCVDSDNDCLPDWLEEILGLDPDDPDSDGNGVPDGEEDIDLDGLSNCAEAFLGTDPTSEDSDNDGLTDGEEVYAFETNPTNADTDFDGIRDGAEIFPPQGVPATDPFKSDTDLDGVDDGLELAEGTDPLDSSSRPPIRFYSNQVHFLNAILGEHDPYAVRSIASNNVSFLNTNHEAAPPLLEGENYFSIRSLMVSYDNDITAPVVPDEYFYTISSNRVSFLNTVTEDFASQTGTPQYIRSHTVSFRNFPPEDDPQDEQDSLMIYSGVVSYLNLQ